MENLERYLEAQKNNYSQALKELQNGKKQSHWMWYIFPQINGLGHSETAKYYEIKSIFEAKEYLNNEILNTRLITLCKTLLNLKTNNPVEVFGVIDALKLKSSMTLFSYVSDNKIFEQVLEKFYNNEQDLNTINICKKIDI